MPKQARRKTWRKNKIQDVEEAIEDERNVERLKRKTGKGKKASGDVFVVDTAGSSDGLSRADKRQLARDKIFGHKRPKLGLSACEDAKVEKAGETAGRRQPQGKKEPDVFDLWAATPVEAAKAKAEKAGTAFPRVKETPKPRPTHVPKTLHQKVSAAPAVLPAHEGQSMNPASGAFEDLACLAAAKQLEKEREEEAMKRQEKPFTSELRDALGAEVVAKMSEEERVKAYRELACPGAIAAEAAGGPADEAAPIVKAVDGMKRKSQSQRNKEKKRKNLNNEVIQKKARQKLAKSVGDIGAILKEMNERDEWLATRKQYREQMRKGRKDLEAKEGVVPKTRRLGRTKFVEDDIIVPDAEASSKGLRSMPLKGSAAIKERLSSITRRGLLPALPDLTKSEIVRRTAKAKRFQRSRKYASPLLRDNLLLKKKS